MLSIKNNVNTNHNNKFKEWVAGLTDGVGNFYISKLGYIEYSVVTEMRDISCLYALKNNYGGDIVAYKNKKAIRYRLHNKKGIISLIQDINGLILNPTRLEQLKKVCTKYNIEKKSPQQLHYSSAYLSGLIDSDGSIYYNKNSKQMFITISQKNKFILEIIQNIYNGKIYAQNKNNLAFK